MLLVLELQDALSPSFSQFAAFVARATQRLDDHSPAFGDEQGRDRLSVWDLLPSFRGSAADLATHRARRG
jgi:hypothetical protein